MTAAVPPYPDMLWPGSAGVDRLGRSASVAELDAAVIDREQSARRRPRITGVLPAGGKVRWRRASSGDPWGKAGF